MKALIFQWALYYYYNNFLIILLDILITDFILINKNEKYKEFLKNYLESLDEFLKKIARGGGDSKKGEKLWWALKNLQSDEWHKAWSKDKDFNLSHGRAHSFIRQADSLKFNSRITNEKIIEKILNK